MTEPDPVKPKPKWTRIIPPGCLVSLLVLALVFFFIISICRRG